ncbi:uncharacterized protein VP01_2186g2 [Puccinia sorghi]|uniref:Uncharacterized protein n=1 Tax=Puccinia sorghi TaxID=27349 RepID=A0A0L6V9B7_9BASI|nr:uncharacterized protein VP01_2186g2 [Puccinia sorghi]
MVVITPNVVYNSTQAMEICDLYLTLSPPASCSNIVIVQKEVDSWLVKTGYRALGSKNKVHGPSVHYLTEELLLYLKDVENSGICLAVAHSEPDSEEVRILNALCVSSCGWAGDVCVP